MIAKYIYTHLQVESLLVADVQYTGQRGRQRVVVLQHRQQVRDLPHHDAERARKLAARRRHGDRGFRSHSCGAGDGRGAPEVGRVDVDETAAATT